MSDLVALGAWKGSLMGERLSRFMCERLRRLVGERFGRLTPVRVRPENLTMCVQSLGSWQVIF